MTSTPQTPLTDEQIIRKHFGNEVEVIYDDQGRAISLTCPRFRGLIEGELVTLLGLSIKCPLNGTFPAELGQLTELKHLLLLQTSLTTLSPEFGNLTKLENVWIAGNLTSLPPEIGRLKNLKKLRLRGNKLTTLPPEIGQLTSLEELELPENNLATLPPEVGQMINLKRLNLEFNQLTTIPPEIGKLTNLEELNLWRNNLTTLPSEIWQMRKDTEIFIELTPP